MKPLNDPAMQQLIIDMQTFLRVDTLENLRSLCRDPRTWNNRNLQREEVLACLTYVLMTHAPD